MATKRTQEQLEVLARQAAWRIFQALELFSDEDPNVRQALEQHAMQHVQSFRTGERVGIEGDGLVKDVSDVRRSEDINTETTTGDPDQAV